MERAMDSTMTHLLRGNGARELATTSKHGRGGLTADIPLQNADGSRASAPVSTGPAVTETPPTAPSKRLINCFPWGTSIWDSWISLVVRISKPRT